MIKSLLRAMVCITICTVSAHAQSVIRYVKPTSSGLGNGTSWADASADIQAMIDDQGVTEVWVAAGTYKPTHPANNMSTVAPGNRNNAFVMKTNVKIYGGFPATGSPVMTDRNAGTYISLLSGDLDNNNTINDNDAHHVVIAAGDAGTALLDGFTISGGTATNSSGNLTITVNNKGVYSNRGGGMAIVDASPQLSHIKFNGNKALVGGAMSLINSSSTLQFIEVTGNKSTSGGGVSLETSEPTFLYTTVSNNTSDTDGGGINIFQSKPSFFNTLIIGNKANRRGGAIYNRSGVSPVFTNVTISGNASVDEGGAIYNVEATSPIIRNSIISGNSSGITTTVAVNYANSMIQGLVSTANGNLASTDPFFQGAPSHNQAPFATGNYQFSPCSPLINKGDNALVADIATDLAGNPRIHADVVDMGAFEFQGTIGSPERRYVKAIASGTGDGTSWENASDDIQLMINGDCVQEVWVAKGTYKAKRAANNLSVVNGGSEHNAFVLKYNLKLYGGFNGTETSLSERVLNPADRSVLSGDMDGSGNRTNADAYHIVISIGDVGAGTLDGFVITQGSASHGNNPITVKGETIHSDMGAGMYISGSSPLIANTSITDNVSFNYGAGIYNSGSSPQINNCLISRNSVTSSNGVGGGIANFHGSSPRIVSSIISGNSCAGEGGGIGNAFYSSPTIINSLITGNRSLGRRGGGAISNEIYSAPNLINVTISGNASLGGIIFSDVAYTIRNSIIWDNQVGLTGTDPVYSNSLIQGKTSTTQGNVVGTSNPYFRNALGFVMAPTTAGDFRLWAESPAINKGDNSFIEGITVDIGGASRIFNDVVDMGAYENLGGYFPVLYVKEGGTGGGTSWEDASGDIQSALHAPQPHEVWVAGGVYKPIRSAENPLIITPGDRNNTFSVTKDVKMYGGFAGTETTLSERNLAIAANRSILSGDLDNTNAFTDRDAYHVLMSVGDVGTAIVDGFTITGGNANTSDTFIWVKGNSIYQHFGGGVLNQSNLSLLKNIRIVGNYSKQPGGGIWNDGNYARDSQSGMVNSGSILSIVNSVISGNSSGFYGGGVSNTSCSPSIINTVISGNRAVLAGGIYNLSASPKIINTTIPGNRSTNTGFAGAMFNTDFNGPSLPVVQNTVIWGNSGGVEGGSPTYAYSLVQGLSSSANGNIPDIDPQFMKGVSYGSAPNAGGDFRIASCSPAVNTGNNAYLGAIETDLAGNNRFFNTTTDIGAYENQGEGSFAIRYVKPVASGTGDGTSWNNASNDLQAMILAPCVQQVWLAGGVYKPSSRADIPEVATPGDRNNAFVLRKDVKIYGGFAGTESALSERNLAASANRSLLSGDLNSSNSVDGGDAYHVVVAVGDLGSALLDGLTIQGGNADGPDEGLIFVNGMIVYQFRGGGLYNNSATISLNGVFLQGNKSSNQGGGIYSERGTLSMTNSVISGNKADAEGGGIYNQSTSSSTLIHVTISGNQGGAISNNNNSTATIANSVVYGNNIGLNKEGFSTSYSLIQGSSSTANHNLADVRPKFANAPAYDTAPFTGGDYHLLSCSPLLNKGNNALLNSIPVDIAGNPRIYGTTADLGAFELQSAPELSSGIRYVRAGVLTGTKDGSSWANASDDIQAMLNDACADQVWVAGGVYKPVRPVNDLSTIDPGNRLNAFVLVNDVKLYGGFAGTEATLAERDLSITANASVLSGDLDGSESRNDQDSYHVVVSAGGVGIAGIDGFTVTGGNSRPTSGNTNVNSYTVSDPTGAGMYILNSSPSISNMTVTDNIAPSLTGRGAGIFLDNSSSTITNSTISNNTSYSGAGVFITGLTSYPELINCTISGNKGSSSPNSSGIVSLSGATVLLTV